jgi:type 1 glutamine amidotransferase
LTVTPGTAEHPVLAGVKPWESRCARMVHYWFSDLADNTQVLLTGTDGDKSQPAAWVRTPKGEFRGRLFYTAPGLPEDFKEANYRRLLINAIFWAADRPKPVPRGEKE